MQICMFVKYSFEKCKGTTLFFVKKGREDLKFGFGGLMEPSQHILQIISHVLGWDLNTWSYMESVLWRVFEIYCGVQRNPSFNCTKLSKTIDIVLQSLFISTFFFFFLFFAEVIRE